MRWALINDTGQGRRRRARPSSFAWAQNVRTMGWKPLSVEYFPWTDCEGANQRLGRRRSSSPQLPRIGKKDNRKWASSDVQSAKAEADWLNLMVSGLTNGNISHCREIFNSESVRRGRWW